MALTGQHACTRGVRHGNGECGFSPLCVRGATRCMCNDEYVRTNVHGVCTICGGNYFGYDAEDEWRASIPPLFPGGVSDDKPFPITITAYRGTKAFKVYGVREDSVSSKVDREGNVTLSFETLQSTDEIGYIPCVDWYTTELEG